MPGANRKLLDAANAKLAEAGRIQKSIPEKVQDNSALIEKPFVASVTGRRRKILRRLVQKPPLSGFMEEADRAAYRARYDEALDAGRRLSTSLGGDLLYHSPSDPRLIFTDYTARGKITIYVHPKAFDTFMHLGYNRGKVFLHAVDNALTEELLHVADLVAIREKWQKLPNARRGSFDEAVKQDRATIFHEIRMARQSATGAARARIDAALVDTYRLYFEEHEKCKYFYCR